MSMTNEVIITRLCSEFQDFEGHDYEYEIPVAYKVEEIYEGSEEPDDPSECHINEMVKVLEDVGPFRKGDMLVLMEDERHELEENELNEARGGYL